MAAEKSREKKLEKVLSEAFPESEFEIVNMSHLHAGHGGDDGTGETHFEIYLNVPELDKLSRVERQRYLHKIIGSELFSEIHSISFHTGLRTN
jgi:BolA family transcriptional regulator, general stress-responsive regulator|tara:strand:+ start:251 stop:529 length:279 start_codon:yes stop_codon:yes gene_type:complete